MRPLTEEEEQNPLPSPCVHNSVAGNGPVAVVQQALVGSPAVVHSSPLVVVEVLLDHSSGTAGSTD